MIRGQVLGFLDFNVHPVFVEDSRGKLLRSTEAGIQPKSEESWVFGAAAAREDLAEHLRCEKANCRTKKRK